MRSACNAFALASNLASPAVAILDTAAQPSIRAVLTFVYTAVHPVVLIMVVSPKPGRMAKASSPKVRTDKAAKAKAKMSKSQMSYMRRALKQIGDCLWEMPDEVPLTLDRLERAKSSGKPDDKKWPTYHRCSQVPKQWIAMKLQSFQPLLTTAILEKVDSDRKADRLRKMMQMATGQTHNIKLKPNAV